MDPRVFLQHQNRRLRKDISVSNLTLRRREDFTPHPCAINVNEFLLPAGVLVRDKKECNGSKIDKGTQPSVSECANQCKDTTLMFIFGTDDYGEIRCNDDGCHCYCETSAAPNGTCDEVNHNGYRLYRIMGNGNIFDCNNVIPYVIIV